MSVAAATYCLAFGLLAKKSGFNIFHTISMSVYVFVVLLAVFMDDGPGEEIRDIGAVII